MRLTQVIVREHRLPYTSGIMTRIGLLILSLMLIGSARWTWSQEQPERVHNISGLWTSSSRAVITIFPSDYGPKKTFVIDVALGHGRHDRYVAEWQAGFRQQFRFRDADGAEARGLVDPDGSNIVVVVEGKWKSRWEHQQPLPPSAAVNQPGKTLFDNWNKDSVGVGPTTSTTLQVRHQTTVSYINTYHWNNGHGTRVAGSIALRHDDGTLYGPWQAVGAPGQNGVPNAVWECRPQVTIKPGRYAVVDSEPASWAHNAASGYAGMSQLQAGTNPEADFWSDVSWSLNARRKYHDAGLAADRALVLAPDQASAWFGKGWSLVGLGQYPRALVALDRGIALDPGDVTAWCNRGIALFRLGKSKEAAASIDKASLLDPNNSLPKKLKRMMVEKAR